MMLKTMGIQACLIHNNNVTFITGEEMIDDKDNSFRVPLRSRLPHKVFYLSSPSLMDALEQVPA